MGWRLRVLLLLVLAVVAPSLRVSSVRAQSSGTSVVYVSPATTHTNNTFSVQVLMNLTSDDAFNTYDIHLSYNFTEYRSTVLNVTGENAAPGADEFTRCIDGVGSGCDISDTIGVVHSAATFSTIYYGPRTPFLLFTVHFSVIGKGINVFHPFNDSIIDPLQGGHPILHLTNDGIYSNVGPTAFFNTAPAILIQKQNVTFDGTGSFDPKGTIVSYSWIFGDGTPPVTGPPVTSALVKHNYTQPGSYSVTLTVSDSNGSGSLTKTVIVVSGLGGIRTFILLSDGKFDRAVTVSLYNGTLFFVQNVTRPAYVTGAANFQNLKPGNYHLIFSGPGVVSASADVTVVPGWTTWYTANLTVIPPPIQNPGLDIRFYLAIATVGAGVVLGSTTILKMRLRRKKRRSLS